MHEIRRGYYGDVWTWIEDENVYDRVFRVWGDRDSPAEECQFVYFTQFIELPDGDVLIGMQDYNDGYEGNRYDMIEYRRLSQIQFSYLPSDQED